MLETCTTILRALRVVQAAGGTVSPREFAARYWPDSPGWKKPARPGRRDGIRFGACMNTAGAAFLKRIARRGVLERRGSDFALTALGARFLERRT